MFQVSVFTVVWEIYIPAIDRESTIFSIPFVWSMEQFVYFSFFKYTFCLKFGKILKFHWKLKIKMFTITIFSLYYSRLIYEQVKSIGALVVNTTDWCCVPFRKSFCLGILAWKNLSVRVHWKGYIGLLRVWYGGNKHLVAWEGYFLAESAVLIEGNACAMGCPEPPRPPNPPGPHDDNTA